MNRETGKGVEGKEDAEGGSESKVREQRNQGRRRGEKILREGRKAGKERDQRKHRKEKKLQGKEMKPGKGKRGTMEDIEERERCWGRSWKR